MFASQSINNNNNNNNDQVVAPGTNGHVPQPPSSFKKIYWILILVIIGWIGVTTYRIVTNPSLNGDEGKRLTLCKRFAQDMMLWKTRTNECTQTPCAQLAEIEEMVENAKVSLQNADYLRKFSVYIIDVYNCIDDVSSSTLDMKKLQNDWHTDGYTHEDVLKLSREYNDYIVALDNLKKCQIGVCPAYHYFYTAQLCIKEYMDSIECGLVEVNHKDSHVEAIYNKQIEGLDYTCDEVLSTLHGNSKNMKKFGTYKYYHDYLAKMNKNKDNDRDL